MIVKNLHFIFINIIIKTHGLQIQPSIINNNILVTASAIRNTTNNLFLVLKLKGIKKSSTLRQYALIHNFFSTLASKDHDTLNHVAMESRIDTSNINNETQKCIDVLNELLNEDPGIDTEKYNKDHLQGHVTEFLSRLAYLKDVNGVNENDYKISEQIVNLLRIREDNNLTQGRDSDENDSLISDNEFWEPEKSSRRIYKGQNTKIKYFPFMASIQIFNRFQCGGSIIKSDLVITAASCVQLAWNNRFFRENPAFLSVRVGSNYYTAGGDNIEVLEVYFHPQYEPKTLRNNICILRLLRRINFKRKRVKKIDFDRNEWSLPMMTDGITIVGWGAKGASNILKDPWTSRLSFSVLDVYPNRECQDIYSKQYVTRKNFCAGFFSKGGGACNGDVGGPGIVGGILTGIVSFGSPRCGTPDAPTVFTKVGFYTDWIETIIEQDVIRSKKITTLRPTLPPSTLKRLNTLKQTTSNIGPIFGTFKPVPINEAEYQALRVLDDENLFKEFLATMFGSQEAKEYEELFIDDVSNVERQKELPKHNNHDLPKIDKPEKQNIKSLESHIHTKVIEDTTEPYHPFTALDKNLMIEDSDKSREWGSNNDEEIENNIKKLLAIENLDAYSDNESRKNTDMKKKIVEDETDDSEGSTHELVLETNEDINIKTEPKMDKDNSLKTLDDSILTLLYFSDSEKNNINESNVIEDFDEIVSDKGLSIAIDNFKDLTFRDGLDNNTGSLYDFLPKDAMYELLAEAIDEVAKDNEKKI